MREVWIRDNWIAVEVEHKNKDQGTKWCKEIIGPRTKYLAPVWAGWMHETHRQGTGGSKIEIFFFKRKGDALAFKLAVGSLEKKSGE